MHEQEQPAREREATTAQRIDISAITPHSSIEAMFDALYQASVTQDYDAMSAVSQAYLQSPHGQAFLQEGREYNRRLEMQQQMARRGPAMRR